MFTTFSQNSPSKQWKEIMKLFAKTGTKIMKKTLILAAGAPPVRSTNQKISGLLWRLHMLSRLDFVRKFSPGGSARIDAAKRLDWNDPAKKSHPHSRPHWLVIAVRGFAQSSRSHPVKIQIGKQK